jgi:hypothetical protein
VRLSRRAAINAVATPKKAAEKASIAAWLIRLIDPAKLGPVAQDSSRS